MKKTILSLMVMASALFGSDYKITETDFAERINTYIFTSVELGCPSSKIVSPILNCLQYVNADDEKYYKDFSKRVREKLDSKKVNIGDIVNKNEFELVSLFRNKPNEELSVIAIVATQDTIIKYLKEKKNQDYIVVEKEPYINSFGEYVHSTLLFARYYKKEFLLNENISKKYFKTPLLGSLLEKK